MNTWQGNADRETQRYHRRVWLARALKWLCLLSCAGIVGLVVYLGFIEWATTPQKWVRPDGSCVGVVRWDLQPLEVQACDEFSDRKFAEVNAAAFMTLEKLKRKYED
jgi:hypothetical protein